MTVAGDGEVRAASTPVDPVAIGAEIEHLVQHLTVLGDSPAAAHAQELVRLLMSMYGAALARMLDVIRTEAGGSEAILERLSRDGLIASLLVLHDLHPDPLESRVARAIKALAPHLPQVTLSVTAVSEDAVRVNVESDAPGDGKERGHLRLAIERAIQEAAPEIATIDIEGLDVVPALIQIVRRAAAAAPQGQP